MTDKRTWAFFHVDYIHDTFYMLLIVNFIVARSTSSVAVQLPFKKNPASIIFGKGKCFLAILTAYI